MLSPNISVAASSPRTLHDSDHEYGFSGMEVFQTDQTPELVPTERLPNLSQPEPSPHNEMKPWLNFNRPKNFSKNASTNEKPSRDPDAKRSRKWRLCLLVIIVLVIAIIIALAVALPLSLRHRGRGSSGTRAAADLSTSISRPINGTGLVQLQLGTSDRDYTTHLYYQDSSGAIRDMQLQNYEWVEASYDGVQLTANARNGTPFAVGSYSVDNVVHLTYHIFYVDSSGVLQETINENGESQWHRGSIGNKNVRPSNTSIGLMACSNDLWNGGNVTDPLFELYYGGDDGLVHEMIYHYNTQEWSSHAIFEDTNGNAGISCSGSNASLSYMFSSSKDNKLQMWWKDFNDTKANSAANSSTHPLGVWTQLNNPTPISIYPNSPIARIRTSDIDNILFYLTPSMTINALQPQLAAENSTWGSVLEVGPGAHPAIGTQLSTGTIFVGNYTLKPNMSDHEYYSNLMRTVFFQDRDTGGLKQFMRRADAGQWLSTDVVLPR